jgi:hypothetical protein
VKSDTTDSGSALSARGIAEGANDLADVLEELAQASLDQKSTFQFSLGPSLIAYARGHQWLEATGNERLFWANNTNVHRDKRVTMQTIRPRLRQYVSMLMRAKPGFDCHPRKSSPLGRQKSFQANFFLDAHMERSNVYQARWLATSSLATLGSGYIEPYFDPTRGAPIESDRVATDPVSGQPVIDRFLGRVRKLGGSQQAQLTGELGANFYTPFEIFPPAGARVPFVEMWPYGNFATVLDEGEARRRYPEHAAQIHASGAPGDWGLDYGDALASIEASANERPAWQGGRPGVVVFKYREPPSSRKGYARGREVHWTPGLILRDGELACPEAGLGVHGLYGDWEPGSAFCQGLVESLRDLADFQNKVCARILRWLQLQLDPPLLNPVGSGITTERLRAGYDKVLDYDPLRGDPKWLQFPQLPSAVFALISLIEAQADRTSSMQPVARGELQRGMPSGVLMQLIQEAQEGVLSVYAHLAAMSWGRYGAHVLALASKAQATAYTVRVLGPQGHSEFLDVPPGDLASVDVSVKEGSMLPRLKTARQVQVVERWGQSLYGNPADPSVVEHVRRELDEPAVIDSSLPGEADRQFAATEDWRMLKLGQPVQVTPYDNGYIHKAEHVLKTRAPGYEQLPEEWRQAHAAHIAEHDKQLQAASQAELDQQLETFKRHEMIKAEAAVIRTQAAMAANIMSAKAAAAIRRGDDDQVGAEMLGGGEPQPLTGDTNV